MNLRASDPGTMTSCSSSLGAETVRISPGLADEGLNVMRLTVRSAFMAPRVFSMCEGSRLGGTAMVYIVFLNFINVVIYTMSTDYDPTDPTEKTPLLPGGGGNDDDDEWRDVDMSLQPIPEEETEQWRFPPDTDPNTTQPYKPEASSTPSGGENIQMTTRLPTEQQGASGGGGTAETSFIEGGAPDRQVITRENIARLEINREFPHADPVQLEFRFKEAPKSGGSIIEVKYHTRDKWYPLFTKSCGDSEKTINTSLSKEIQNALGESTTEAFNKTNSKLQDLQKQEAAQLKALHQAQTKAIEAQRIRREMDAIRNRTKDAEDRIQQLEDTQGRWTKRRFKS